MNNQKKIFIISLTVITSSCSYITGPEGYFPPTKYDFIEEKIEKFLLEKPEVILKSWQNVEEKKAKEQEVTNEKIINENLDILTDSSNGLYDGNITLKK